MWSMKKGKKNNNKNKNHHEMGFQRLEITSSARGINIGETLHPYVSTKSQKALRHTHIKHRRGAAQGEPGVIRCVIHPLRLHESLSGDKQQRSRRLEFERVVCEMA